MFPNCTTKTCFPEMLSNISQVLFKQSSFIPYILYALCSCLHIHIINIQVLLYMYTRWLGHWIVFHSPATWKTLFLYLYATAATLLYNSSLKIGTILCIVLLSFAHLSWWILVIYLPIFFRGISLGQTYDCLSKVTLNDKDKNIQNLSPTKHTIFFRLCAYFLGDTENRMLSQSNMLGGFNP